MNRLPLYALAITLCTPSAVTQAEPGPVDPALVAECVTERTLSYEEAEIPLVRETIDSIELVCHRMAQYSAITRAKGTFREGWYEACTKAREAVYLQRNTHVTPVARQAINRSCRQREQQLERVEARRSE